MTQGDQTKGDAGMGIVIPFPVRPHTLDVGEGDGFECMVCGHWLYESETEWGDLFVCKPKRFGHIHGTEPFRFCPHCGAMVLTPSEWAEAYPQDQGKTIWEVARRFYEEVE